MFDPLDLYDASNVQIVENNSTVKFNISDKSLSLNCKDEDSSIKNTDDDEENIPITVLDLPPVRHATPNIIFTVLKLLRNDAQLNFKSQTTLHSNGIIINSDDGNDTVITHIELEKFCLNREIDSQSREEILQWYTTKCPNSLLNTMTKIITKIPRLRTTESKDKLLNYYTSILRFFEQYRSQDLNEANIIEQLLKEASLRISESCGRTALPSIHRNFQFNNLQRIIQLYEPSLTADNLGWKTWGSSMILSQILVERDENFNIEQFKDSGSLRVLELGSGTGLVGITWATKWRELYGDTIDNVGIFLTDLPEIVDNLKQNVKDNELDRLVQVDILDWTNPGTFIEKYGDDQFDVVLVADPIYLPEHPKWIVNMINRFMKPNGVCHLEIPIREKYAKERELLNDLLRDTKLSIIEQKYEEGYDDWGLVTYLYRKIIRE